MDAVEHYLRDLRAIRASGAATDETAYYAPLRTLLNHVGKSLKPRVESINGMRNQGAGMPDFGLFTSDQLRNSYRDHRAWGNSPSRGVIEAKLTSASVTSVADSNQVQRYWSKYGQVLVTNYRDFLLIGRDDAGQPTRLERFSLAVDEHAFWAADPRELASSDGQRLYEYLQRVLLRPAALTDPKDLAWFLASYAREAQARVEKASLPGLADVRSALEQALGLTFEGEKGEHFFRSSLVQTLFYGVFSAWVLWSKSNPPTAGAHFDWRTAVWHLRVPVISALFSQLAIPSRLRPLNLEELLDWVGETLHRVDRAAFFTRFDTGLAVRYFYEPFLKEFDPQLREAMGVWFTPPEVVQYMVERVDRALREELSITDGLADPRVVVLDPCCGTGAYLVEVLKRVHRTLLENGGDALVGDDVKRAARERIFGFELLAAPFVVAHLQLGLMLQNIGAPFADDGSERAGVYLTNSLTGWETPTGARTHLMFPELEAERDAADRVKRHTRVLVVLGNPPYNAYAGVSPKEEQGLVEPYKVGLVKKWNIKKFNLDDLYVRFFRIAERCVAEQTGRGVVCYISNFSYLSDASFVVLRERLLNAFDDVWIDCLNGDSRQTGKLTAEGKPDPSVFSTEYNREGIRVGTAIALMVRNPSHTPTTSVQFRQFWGVEKRSDLIGSLKSSSSTLSTYTTANPVEATRFSFRPQQSSADYLSWPRVNELSRVEPFPGVVEKRKGALISIERDVLEHRMRQYLDPTIDWDSARAIVPGLTTDAARFDAKSARKLLMAREGFDSGRIQRFMVLPFDARWCYHTTVRPIWNEPRPAYSAQLWNGNAFVVTRRIAVASDEGRPFFFSTILGDDHAFLKDAYYIPLEIRDVSKSSETQPGLFESSDGVIDSPQPNLSMRANAYIAQLELAGATKWDRHNLPIWPHILAVGSAPLYMHENGEAMRDNWPRVPLPATAGILESSSNLGRRLAMLQNTEEAVPGVTTGTVSLELRSIAPLTALGSHSLSPGAGDLDVTARWGYVVTGGIVMGAAGRRVEREYTPAELHVIETGAAAMGMTCEQALECLGESTSDVYLNDVAYWSNVPEKVWQFTVGGYQLMKKWLSYRDHAVLGRGLTTEEARYVTEMARRIAAVLLMGPALDANYDAVKANPYSWPSA